MAKKPSPQNGENLEEITARTIRFPEKVWRKMKAHAAENGYSMNEWLLLAGTKALKEQG